MSPSQSLPKWRRPRTILATVLALALLAAVGWLVHYRATYHTFAWWEAPPELSYCGRDYEALPGPTARSVPSGSTYTHVNTIEPAGFKVLAADATPCKPGSGEPSATSLWVETDGHHFAAYTLLGGP